MNIKLWAAAPLIAMIAACTTSTDAPKLAGRTLVWAESPAADVVPSITFHNDLGISGKAGCNLLTGQIRQDGTKIDFSQLGSTKRMCSPKEMEVENAFLEGLSKTVYAVADGAKVQFLDKDHKVLLTMIDQK